MAVGAVGNLRMRRSRAIGITIGIASLMLVMAAPAHAVADNQGSATDGVGAEDSITLGTDYGDPPSVLCFEVTENTNTVQFHGNDDVAVNATTTSPSATATYTHSADLTWSITEPMYINPDGAYSAPASPAGTGCDDGTLGDPIAATASFTGSGANGSVNCSSSAGGATYTRVGTSVTVTWTGTCTVDGDGSQGTVTTPTSVTSTFSGTETPCITPPNNCENSTLAGTFTYG